MKAKAISMTICVILLLSLIVMPMHVSAVGAPIVGADAESWDRSEGDPMNAIDGDPGTFWHSLWNMDAAAEAGLDLDVNAEGDYPQILIVEFDGVHEFDCIGYLGRSTSGSRNGLVLEYEFWATETGSKADLQTDDGWKKIANGTWDEFDDEWDDQEFRNVKVDPVKAKAVKLKVLDGIGGWACCAALEFNFLDVAYTPMEGFNPGAGGGKGSENLGDVIGGGKNPIMNPEFIDGGKGFGWDNDDNPTKESSPSLFVYDEDDEDNPKYCMNMNIDEQEEHGGKYWAEWKYDKAYSINGAIFRTGNDSEEYPRRMGDGYTISGSNDGSSWEVIYTGKEMDTEAENFMYYYIDIAPTAAYQYFRLNADTAGVSQDDGGENQGQLIQYSMLILTSADAPAYVAPWKATSYKLGEGSTVINAVDFDSGEYNERNASDGDHTIRPDEDVQTEIGASGYGGNIGWTMQDEWVQYTVNVNTAGKYNFKAYLASGSDNAGAVSVSYDGTVIGEAQSINLGGDSPWQVYDWYNVGDFDLPAGKGVIKVEFVTDGGGVNFAALDVTLLEAAAAAEPEESPADEPGDDDGNADDGDETPAAANDDNNAATDDDSEGPGMILWIVIGAAAVVIIVIILIILTRKKK
ncbi:MAG: discoidin domain-containing protein [Oscillospiraceae bacterium]|nr:discoidin domain-containing protein [Oscillospiraceae bacterium]